MDNCNSIINKIYLKIKLNEIQKKKRIVKPGGSICSELLCDQPNGTGILLI